MSVPETFAITDAVQLAVVERSGFIESRHAGIAIVLAPDGTVLRSLGKTDALIFPRSSLKPFQSLASQTAGVTLTGEWAALSTASHSGTDRHVAIVRDMLTSVGLTEDDLGCPEAWPGDTATRNELLLSGGGMSRLRMNCSGKHAAMLMACVSNGWSTADYLSAAHPLQIHTREVVERLIGERVATVGIDGCGAPVFAMTLAGLARGVQRIATSSERSPFALHRFAGALAKSVREHPWAIDGPGRPDTIVIEQTGAFAKGGAEAVMVMAAPDGTTVALKVLDGGARACAIVALHLLQEAGALAAETVATVAASLSLAVHGGGEVVGAIRPAILAPQDGTRAQGGAQR